MTAMNGERSDEDLVREFQAGREEAFRELVVRYKERAMQLARMTTGNDEDAKDVSQDAFVKIHANLERFEMRSKFSTWFYRLLINTARDFVRRRKWTRFLRWKSREAMEDFFESVPSPSASSGQEALREELRRHITEAIKTLPFQQQWMFTLRHLKGFSIQQIADVAEVSEGTVKATLHFAAEKFKKGMAPYWEGETS